MGIATQHADIVRYFEQMVDGQEGENHWSRGLKLTNAWLVMAEKDSVSQDDFDDLMI